METYATLLPAGRYRPLLLQLAPDLVMPGAPGDYFSDEQVRVWGIDRFWGMPENPRTPYYRTFDASVADDAQLHEFVVPMVPPSWNDAHVVAEHRERLARSSRPTAVALTTLDVRAPATTSGRSGPGTGASRTSSSTAITSSRPRRSPGASCNCSRC